MNKIIKNLFASTQKVSVATLCIVYTLSFTAAGCGKSNSGDEDFTDFFYNDKGEKSYLKIRKDKLILKCTSAEDAKALTKEPFFTSAYDVGHWVIGTIEPKKTKLDELLKEPEVVSATYGLEYSDGTLQYPTDRIYVKFKEGLTPEAVLDEIGLTESVEAIELFNPYSEIYKITLNVGLGDILKICRELFETDLCEWAEPNFFREMKVGI